MLKTNVRNRPVVRAVVEEYIKELKRDNWIVNGESIKFDWDGNIVDGQHRLLAVVESGISMTTLVVYGVDPRGGDRIDIGRPRGVLDNIRIAGSVEWDKARSSYLKTCSTLCGYHGAHRTIQAVESARAPFMPGIEMVVGSVGSIRPWCAGPIGGALAFAFRPWPAAAERFARALASGEGLQEGDPELAMRRYFERTLHAVPSGGQERRALAARVLGGVWARHEGRRLLKSFENTTSLDLARAAYTKAELAEAFGS